MGRHHSRGTPRDHAEGDRGALGHSETQDDVESEDPPELTEQPEKGIHMFLSSWLVVAIVLLVAWVLGWLAFHVAGGLIHLLLVVAVISLVVHFMRGRP